MFTAITVTKNLLKMFVGTSISEKYLLLGAKPGQKKRKPFEIIKNSKKWFIFSGAITLIALVSVLSFGLKLGIDFSGGTLMQVKFEQEVQKDELKTELEKIGREISENGIEEPAAEEVIEESTEAQVAETSDEEPQKEPVIKELDKEIDLSTASVIWSSDGYIIKTKYMPSDVHEVILNKLEQKFGPLEEPRFTTVGPTVGETMKAKATIALLIALVAIVFYIAFAFRKIPRQVSPWRFGLSAIVALAHDVLIVVGIYAILGQVLGVEIDALFITALLTILGFSVHDTIVVFDRVRENLKNLSRDTTFAEVANRALNQTMARSINTSLSTLFTLVALLLLGGASIYYFVLALVIGTIVGTYSSIFVASPVLVWWNTRAHKKKQY
jgi:preprotein translocase subunit SecF